MLLLQMDMARAFGGREPVTIINDGTEDLSQNEDSEDEDEEMPELLDPVGPVIHREENAVGG